eukprot:8451031-Pyramimonas_sp.AAC.1
MVILSGAPPEIRPRMEARPAAIFPAAEFKRIDVAAGAVAYCRYEGVHVSFCVGWCRDGTNL